MDQKKLPKGRESLYVEPYNGGWDCPECGLNNTGRVCEKCGYKRPSLLKRILGK